MAISFTDIRPGGWVARAPARWRPYLLLARLDRPIGIWLLFLPGAWGILLPAPPTWDSVRLLALFAVGSAVMRAAGCVINDLWDRDLDRLVTRTAGRPLASGAVSVRQAMCLLAVLLSCGLLVLLQLRPLCWALGVGCMVLVALYPLAKRVTWWPQLVMGFTFGFGAPMGYAAVNGRIDAACAALYAAAIFWDLGFDTIYGFQDIEDDALIGVKSTSRRFAHMPKRFLAASYAAAVVFLVMAAWLANATPTLLVLPAAAMALQVVRLNTSDPAGCLALFKFNRETGLLVLPALLATRW